MAVIKTHRSNSTELKAYAVHRSSTGTACQPRSAIGGNGSVGSRPTHRLIQIQHRHRVAGRGGQGVDGAGAQGAEDGGDLARFGGDG
ncbi:MAG TPA: hypothetical protein PLU79_21880, partial [Burkholderiaceae bacterium]|nr:hypothetical protein [Burkholderiaceae bacterium]